MPVSCRRVRKNTVLRNLSILRKALPDVLLMAVVKNDGYGSGALPMAEAALACGFDAAGVARVSEGILLRKGGIRCPVFILSGTAEADWKEAIEENLIFPLDEDGNREKLSLLSESLGKTAEVMIPVDTGLHRIGVTPSQVIPFAKKVDHISSIRIKGFFTHLVDPDSAEKPFAGKQQLIWNSLVEEIQKAFPRRNFLFSASDSAAAEDMDFKENMARIGSLLHGIQPSPDVSNPIPVEPVMDIVSHVTHRVFVKKGETVGYNGLYRAEEDQWIATVPVGYGDGYRRTLSGRASVLIQGKRRKILGLICMDQMMVESDEHVKTGEEVILLGKQGKETIRAEELAGLADANVHEWLGGFRRLPLIWE